MAKEEEKRIHSLERVFVNVLSSFEKECVQQKEKEEEEEQKREQEEKEERRKKDVEEEG